MSNGLTIARTGVRGCSSYRRMTVSEGLVIGLVILSDALAVALSGAVMYVGYLGSHVQFEAIYLTALVTLVAHIGLWGYCIGLYDFETVVAWPRRMSRLFLVMASAFLFLAGLAFAFKVSAEFSRVWVVSTVAISTVVAFAARGGVVHFLLRWISTGGLRRNMAIVGAGEQACRFVASVKHSSTPWHRIVGVFDDRQVQRGNDCPSCPLLGNLSNLETYVRMGNVNTIVLAVPWNSDKRVADLINRFREFPVTIYLAPDLVSYACPTVTRSYFAKLSIYEVASPPLSGWNAVIKECEDKILAGLLVLLFAPMMAVIAVTIKLESSGPVLFRQRRYGFNNEVFLVRKFRTMYHNRLPEEGVPQATRGDLRVTRAGRFLRCYSLDELPQLFDVLQGTMSLVGPRPHAVEHNKKYASLISGYDARHRVKPGITGWAQVRGWRGETRDLEKMRFRIEHDAFYTENWSLWLDIKILALTCFLGWHHENTY